MGQDERHDRDTARTGRDEREGRSACDEERGTVEDETPPGDFPSVPARDLGIEYTRDVDPPPNTGGEPPDVPGPPG